MWDIDRDDFDSFQSVGILDFYYSFLGEPTMEVVLFANDEDGDNEEVIGAASTSS